MSDSIIYTPTCSKLSILFLTFVRPQSIPNYPWITVVLHQIRSDALSVFA